MNVPDPRPLAVVHETRYDYDAPVELAHHLTYLRPRDDTFQTLEAYSLHISPEPGAVRDYVDDQGNWRTTFALSAPHEALVVRASSRVIVRPRFASLDFAAGSAWEEAARRLRYRAGEPYVPQAEFSFPSPYVPLHARLRDYALASFTPGRPLPEAALHLMHRVHADFTYAPASTQVTTPVLEAFEEKRGVCQDYAHVMIGCLRALGLAVRYVSGYLVSQPPPGQARLIGADASHAWVSVHCPGLPTNGGWLDLDPTNDLVPGGGHVTVAYGRDYGDVTPLRGVIRGGGEHDLTVRVTVMPWDEAPEELALP
jgi:transglutaminase-like putative cysteine protease